MHALEVALAVAALGGLAVLLPPRTANWTQAVLLIWDSGSMAVVALVVCASVWALLGGAQRRAITPRLRFGACATVGSADEFLAHRSLIAPGGQRERSSGHHGLWAAALIPSSAATWLTRTTAVGLLAVGAVVVLAASGHLPRVGTASGTAVLTAMAWLVVAATVGALRVRHRVRYSSLTKAIRAVIARRGPHATIVAVFGEIALGLVVAWVAALLTHTAGLPAPGVAEVVAVALLARLFTFVPWPPIGLGLADGILVFGLTLINVPTVVAIATTLIWRTTGLVVITTGFLAARHMRPHVAFAAEVATAPTDSRIGKFVHRAGFALLALLPGPVASVVRRRLFDAMFGMSDDPWDYALMPYEHRKQAQLVATIPSGAGVILEMGCADGHNVASLAALHPGSTVIGVDISGAAVTKAARRTSGHSNALVVQADARSAAVALDEFRGQVDVLVLSEVLYYLGTSVQVQQALMPLRALLSPGASVVLVHGAYDAQHLHAPACTALGAVHLTSETLVDDPDRPYVVTVANTRRDEVQVEAVSVRSSETVRWPGAL